MTDDPTQVDEAVKRSVFDASRKATTVDLRSQVTTKGQRADFAGVCLGKSGEDSPWDTAKELTSQQSSLVRRKGDQANEGRHEGEIAQNRLLVTKSVDDDGTE